MGWSLGYDDRWGRWIGYGVPAICDHPSCNEKIDRGLSFVCGSHPYGGEHGCGLYFCEAHMTITWPDGEDGNCVGVCERCAAESHPFTAKPDTPEWIQHLLTHDSWKAWRDENPDWVIQHSPASNREGG